jgi:hypothetical protein
LWEVYPTIQWLQDLCENSVFLTIDPTVFDGGTEFLTAFSLALKTGLDISTAFSLVTAAGGASAWSTRNA